MKYMIMMFGEQSTLVQSRSADWIKKMIEFMHTLNDDLANAG